MSAFLEEDLIHELRFERRLGFANPLPKVRCMLIRKFKDRVLHEITWYVQKMISISIAEFRRCNRSGGVVREDLSYTIRRLPDFVCSLLHVHQNASAIRLAFH